MHLLDTTLFYSPTSGGVKSYLTAKQRWFAVNSSWRHSVLVPGESTQFEAGAISTVAGWKVPGTFNYRLPLNPRAWSRAMRILDPDCIEVGDAFHTAWVAAGHGQRHGIPVCAFYHSNLPRIIGQRYGARIESQVRRYVRWLYSRFDVVFAPSRFMCEYLNDLGVRYTSLQPLGVDATVFHPARRNEEARTRLNLSPGTRLLVYAGRFSQEKNIEVLLRAFARLGRRYHLLLIGGDTLARPASNVTRIPYCRDPVELSQWLASADALVHAGTRETFGLVILEAMACGRPVVAARAGAIPELVDEQVGQLAEPLDDASLAEAIDTLYSRNPAQLGLAARERVVSQFTWQRCFERQQATYVAITQGHAIKPMRVEAGTEVIELRTPTS
ncbi:MAG: glycosyltransferase [Steroidobacteraceae bacterium]